MKYSVTHFLSAPNENQNLISYIEESLEELARANPNPNPNHRLKRKRKRKANWDGIGSYSKHSTTNKSLRVG